MLNIPVWFKTEVLPHFENAPADYMHAFYDLPANQLLEIANYVYELGFSAFLGEDSIAFKRRQP